MRAAKVQASLRIRAVSPEPSLLAHTSSESRGTFRQKTRSLAFLNGCARAVKICHHGMLEDTNSLDGAHIITNLLIEAPDSVVCKLKSAIMILSFRTDRSGQTVQTQIRLLLKEQSDQGLHCLQFPLHLSEHYSMVKPPVICYRSSSPPIKANLGLSQEEIL